MQNVQHQVKVQGHKVLLQRVQHVTMQSALFWRLSFHLGDLVNFTAANRLVPKQYITAF